MTLRTLVSLLAALCLAGVLGCGTATAGTLQPRQSTVDSTGRGSPGCGSGRTEAALPATVLGREYLHHAPPGYTSRTPLPLILGFHGAEEDAARFEGYSGLDIANAVVLYPQGRRYNDTDRGWSPTTVLPDRAPDLLYVAALVFEAERTLCIDPGRVYATGKSQGAGFTYLLACATPFLVSAIAPVSGAYYRPGGDYHGVRVCPSAPRRVLEFHGTADSVIAYTGTARSRPIRTVLRDGVPDQGWLDDWVRRDRCTGEETVTSPAEYVLLHRWTHCADNSEVIHYQTLGGDHNWPGSVKPSGPEGVPQTISATDIVLDFFHIEKTSG